MSAFDVRIVGPGRAGSALAAALADAGWRVDGPLGRDHDPAPSPPATRLVLLAVPDGAVAAVAASLAPGEAVVAHVAGSLGLDVLAPHQRVASVHPLVSLPDADARRPPAAPAPGSPWPATRSREEVVARSAAGPSRSPTPTARPTTPLRWWPPTTSSPCSARSSGSPASVDVPLEAYLDLARGALDNVAEVGPGRRAHRTRRPGRPGDRGPAPAASRWTSGRPTPSWPSGPAPRRRARGESAVPS